MVPAWMRLLPRFIRRPLEERTYLQRVVAHTGWALAERVLRYAVGFVVGIWMARYLGPEQYGLLNFAMAFVTVFAFMTALGLDSLAVREIVRNPGVRDEMIGTLVTMRLIGGLAMLAVVALAVAGVGPADERAPVLIAVITGAHVVQAFTAIDCWFQAALLSRYAFAVKAAAVLAGAAIRIVLIVNDAPLVAFAWATLAESALLASGMLVAYVRLGAPLRAMRPGIARVRALLVEGWPLVLSALVAAVNLRIDQVMLAQMAGFAEVGAYAVAARVVEVSYILPAVLTSAIFPAMIQSMEADPGRYQQRIQRLFDAIIWLAIVISVPMSMLAPVIVDLLVGRAYAGAAPVLAILAWMPLLIFFGMLRQRWLVAENQFAAALSVEALGCALNVLCNLMLIPRFGAVGAAVAALISAAGSTLLLVPFMPSIRRSVRMLLVAFTAPVRALRSGSIHL
jgi:polysaccharide transporter, PST family